MDEAFRPRPSTAEQLEGLALFDGPAPSAPGSVSSEDAADSVSEPLRSKNHKRILWALFTVTNPRSMADISKRTGIPVHVLCARLSELRPMWVTQHDRACISSVKPSLRVDGYTLTDASRRLVQAALDKSR